MTPTIGRIVHYQLSKHDADAINSRRADANAYARMVAPSDGMVMTGGLPGRTGHVAHVGNQASEGDVCAATVVRTFGGPAANLQVHLDGNDTYWATSRTEGDQPGQWSWPPRV